MSDVSYAAARLVAPRLSSYFRQYAGPSEVPTVVPDVPSIERLIDAAFWASLRREEGHVPRISLAFLAPEQAGDPLIFARPLPLTAAALARVSPAAERPGIHLGAAWLGGELRVWGTTRHIPSYAFVVEVAAPGLLVIKHHRGGERRKFVNIAVLEGDYVRVVDERASTVPDCPALLSTLLGFDTRSSDAAVSVLVQLAVSMRNHGRGGLLLVVPHATDEWRDSIVQPMLYGLEPSFAALAELLTRQAADHTDPRWDDGLARTVDAIAGLTAVDGATIMTDRYELLAFGAKISRRRDSSRVQRVTVTEPIEGGSTTEGDPALLGGTRHLAAAQFVYDQRSAMALVASQDGRFTIFAWSPCADTVHAHRVETLLL